MFPALAPFFLGPSSLRWDAIALGARDVRPSAHRQRVRRLASAAVATHVAESIVVDLPVGVAYGRWLEDLESAGVWINDQTRDNEIAWTDTGDDRRTGVVLFEVLRRDSTSVELRLSVDRDGADEELRQQALADLELFRERAAT
jgi:hypothetical protein